MPPEPLAAEPVAVKPGRHREATLYHALPARERATAGIARSQQLREAALAPYDTSELPVWRRSGFWTTSLQTLDLDALETAPDAVAPGGRARGRAAHAPRPCSRRAARAERRHGRARRARPRAAPSAA